MAIMGMPRAARRPRPNRARRSEYGTRQGESPGTYIRRGEVPQAVDRERETDSRQNARRRGSRRSDRVLRSIVYPAHPGKTTKPLHLQARHQVPPRRGVGELPLLMQSYLEPAMEIAREA